MDEVIPFATMDIGAGDILSMVTPADYDDADSALPPSAPAGDAAASSPTDGADTAMVDVAEVAKGRLAIANLRMENFKSYGGVVDVGPFHKSFSAVVGPNGSGKSNVIDAMLFVFGRRAKQLRHSKLRELLHHSDTYPDVPSATVTVFFHDIVDTGDEDDDFEIVPGSKFSVARRAFRNDSSKYYVDGKEVKMAKVVDILKGKGVDLDNNRFLILQGEVEQIAMMKAKAASAHEDGLLEYLEDIIGSNRHLEAIAKSGELMEALNEERSHKLNRVKAAERERDGLEDAKTEAEDYMDKERDLLTKRLHLTRSSCADHSAKLVAQKKEKVAADEILKVSRETLKDAESRAEVLQKEFAAKKSVADQISQELQAAKDKYASSERADIQLGTDLKAIKAKEKKAKATLERELKRAETAESDLVSHEGEMKEAEALVDELKEKLAYSAAELDRVHAQVRLSTEPLRVELEKKQEALLPLKDTVNQCKRDADVTEQEQKILEESLKAPQVALEKATTGLSSLREELKESQAKKDNIAKRHTEAKAAVAIGSSSLETARETAKESSSLVSSLRRKLEEAKQTTEAFASSSKLLSSLYKASREGLLKGIVGRLGDLGTIADEYGTAAGAAAGSNLDNMVVHRAEDAQACIQFMRKHNLGRCTFIILEKIVYLTEPMNSNRSFDGPRLFDHVRTSDKSNRIAFFFALRDTLVAPTIEDARRMAYKPSRMNRVVTVSGELIESSGAMTGGGRGPPRHRLASKSSGVNVAVAPADAVDTRQVARQLDDALSASQNAQADIDRLEGDLRKLAIDLERIVTELTMAGSVVKSLQTRVAEASKTLPGLKQAAIAAKRAQDDKQNPKRMKMDDLLQKVADFNEALEQAKNACVDLETDVSNLQSKIVEAGGQEMKDAKEAVEADQKAVSENKSALSSAKSRAAASQKSSQSARKAVSKATTDIEKAGAEKEATLKKRSKIEDEAAAFADSSKDLESKHDDAAEVVSNLTKDYSAVKAELKKGRQAEQPLVDAVSEAKRAVLLSRAETQSKRKLIKKLEKKLSVLAETAAEASLSSAAVAVVEDAAGENEEESEKNEDGGESEHNALDGGNGEGAADVDGADVDDNLGADGGEEKDDTTGENVVDAGDVLSSQDKSELEMAVSVLEAELSRLKPNLGAIAEYRRKNDEYKGQVTELDSLTAKRDVARKENDGLRKARLDEFMKGFSAITLKLKELYQMITLGGDAELELVDSLDPFSEGIVFSVRPPKKSWKNISNLSGGEKTLSSLALVFALHHFKPTPLYFLDEIDAALDFKNVSIVANYVKERTKNAQFIIISLRNNMFELADRLVGIYKTHNTTKSVTVNPKAFAIPQALAPSSALPAAHAEQVAR